MQLVNSSDVQQQDLSESLRQKVLAAYAGAAPLRIVGGGSKSFYGRAGSGEALALSGHSGVVNYQPTELILTARTGTPLSAIEVALAERDQMLGFEPPHFGAGATLGGTVACGLSGPRRPYAGSVRDCVLGIKMINGKGEILRFGGEVMKNVAGFDLSRLMVGALGTLGLLLEVSLKLLPRPESETTLVFEMPAADAIAAMNRWAHGNWPISGLCHDGCRLYLRVAGAEAALRVCRQRFGGEVLPQGEAFWADLREQRLGFFSAPGRLWRLSLAPASSPLKLPGDWFIDWGGSLRWLKTDASAAEVFDAAQRSGGHATLFRAGTAVEQVFQPLSRPLGQLHIRLKKALDPKGIFNPGRMYQEW